MPSPRLFLKNGKPIKRPEGLVEVRQGWQKSTIESAQSLEFFGITQELLDKFDVLVEKYLAPTLNK